MALGSEQTVDAVLEDWRTAPVDERLRTTLGFLQRVTLAPAELGPADVAPLRAAGVEEQAVADALLVAVSFNLITRMADALGAEPLSRSLAREDRLAHEARFLEGGYV